MYLLLLIYFCLVLIFQARKPNSSKIEFYSFSGVSLLIIAIVIGHYNQIIHPKVFEIISILMPNVIKFCLVDTWTFWCIGFAMLVLICLSIKKKEHFTVVISSVIAEIVYYIMGMIIFLTTITLFLIYFYAIILILLAL